MAFCAECLEGARAKIQELLVAVGLSGIAQATHHDLLELVTELESIQESRVSVDQVLLADLIRKYDSQMPSRPHHRLHEHVPLDLPVENREYKMLPLPSETLRPILEGTTASELLGHLRDEFDVPLHPHFVLRILELSIDLYQKRDQAYGPVMKLQVPGLQVPGASAALHVNVTESGSPGPSRIVVLGDTHGQLADVLWAVSELGIPSEKNVYVVNGDIADRCDWSTEIFMLFLTIMLQYPNDPVVVINRGNHECMTINGSRCGGFQYELLEKYGATWGPYLHALFGQLFSILPVGTLVNDAVLIIHGGVGRDPENQLTRLRDLDPTLREASINPWGLEGDVAMDSLVDALWSDPSDVPGSRANARGTGHIWGPDYTNRFCQSNDVKLVVRSHQVPLDQSGVYVHKAHKEQVITVFSASNYRGRKNRAGAVILQPGASPDLLEALCHNLGQCPSWRVLSKSANLRRPRTRLQSDTVDHELIAELLQHAMGLLAEWRVPLWEACTREDPKLTGVIPLYSWRRICRSTTKIYIDWVLVARLVGGASQNNLRYMETLNRFGFEIASQVVESRLASSVLASIYLTMMRADESLQHLMGSLCQAGQRAAPARELLDGLCEILRRNDVTGAALELQGGHELQGSADRLPTGPEMAAVLRSMEAHIGSRRTSLIDVADFLSAWRCAAGVSAELTREQSELSTKISRLLGHDKRCRKRISSLAPASSTTLMDFFTLADTNGDGFMSIEEGFEALMKHMKQTTGREATAAEAAELRGVLQVADTTGTGKLNYLEFLLLFDRQSPRSLTHQAVLDLLCFQVWAHRNALSGLFRYIGRNGLITRDQVKWSLEALNSSINGELLQANIEQIVKAVKFKDDLVAGEELLNVYIPQGFLWHRLFAGTSHSCGIIDTGETLCWGRVREGQCDVPRGYSFVELTLGEAFTCGLTVNSELLCWGSSLDFELDVPPGNTWLQADAGTVHTCAVNATGKMHCWGKQGYGRQAIPYQEDDNVLWEEVACGDRHCCGIVAQTSLQALSLRQEDNVICWGDDSELQLQVPGKDQGRSGVQETFSSISAGNFHTCGLTLGLEVWCWGRVSLYRLDFRTPGNATALSCGGIHACILDIDQKARCWGSDNVGQSGVPLDAATYPPSILDYSNDPLDINGEDPSMRIYEYIPGYSTPLRTKQHINMAIFFAEFALAGSPMLTFTHIDGSPDPYSPHVIEFPASWNAPVINQLNISAFDLSHWYDLRLGPSPAIRNITSTYVNGTTQHQLVDGGAYSVVLSYQDSFGHPAAIHWLQRYEVSYDLQTLPPTLLAPAPGFTKQALQVSFTLLEDMFPESVWLTMTFVGTFPGFGQQVQDADSPYEIQLAEELTLRGTYTFDLNLGELNADLAGRKSPYVRRVLTASGIGGPGTRLTTGGRYNITLRVADRYNNAPMFDQVSDVDFVWDVATEVTQVAEPTTVLNSPLVIEYTLTERAQPGSLRFDLIWLRSLPPVPGMPSPKEDLQSPHSFVVYPAKEQSVLDGTALNVLRLSPSNLFRDINNEALAHPDIRRFESTGTPVYSSLQPLSEYLLSISYQDLFENPRTYLNRTLQTNFTVPGTPQPPTLKSRTTSSLEVAWVRGFTGGLRITTFDLQLQMAPGPPTPWWNGMGLGMVACSTQTITAPPGLVADATWPRSPVPLQTTPISSVSVPCAPPSDPPPEIAGSEPRAAPGWDPSSGGFGSEEEREPSAPPRPPGILLPMSEEEKQRILAKSKKGRRAHMDWTLCRAVGVDLFRVAVYWLTEYKNGTCEKGVAKKDQVIGQCQRDKEACFRDLGAAETRRDCQHLLAIVAGFLGGLICGAFLNNRLEMSMSTPNPPQWLQQDGALVRFRDDPDLLHFREVVKCTEGNHCFVLTPDRDLNEVDLEEGNMFVEVKRMQPGRLPRGIRDADTYLPRHSGGGEFTAEELRHYAQVAEKLSKGGGAHVRRVGKVGTGGLDVLPGGAQQPAAQPLSELAWMQVFGGSPGSLGAEVFPPPDSAIVNAGSDKYTIFVDGLQGGQVVLARQVSRAGLEAAKRLLSPPDNKGSERDVRVLPVLFDSAEERWRTVAEAVPESEEVDYEDFPLAGPRTVMRDMRQLRRAGQDFLQHHESWIKKSGVRSTDRSVHEHSSLCRALHLMICYDQLNAPALAAAEALSRRRALIEFAHHGRPEAPSYEGAEDLLGVREASDGAMIDPALTSFAAKKAASKAEVLKQQRLAAEEKRHRRNQAAVTEDEATVRSLNQMAGFVDEKSWPVEDMSDQEALRQLLARRAGYGDSPGALASLVLERLSLPRGQSEPVSLLDVLPEDEVRRVQNFEDDMMLSPEERAAVLEQGLEGECHIDPVLLHDTWLYHRFIAELYSCNLIHFTVKPRVQIGAFVVTKKNNKQRLIIDARRTNRLFRTPPCTLLGSAETWSRLEELAELIDLSAAPIYPCMAVLPMGFSWAFHLAHKAHVHIASSALPHVNLMQDRTPIPKLGAKGESNTTAMLIYADNNNHVGTDLDKVAADQDAVMGALHQRGLDTHDVTEAASLAESLGVRIDGMAGHVLPTPKRDWRLDRALSAICRGVKLSGQELQVVIGHVTVRSLLHRGLMGIIRYAYAFIEKNYTRRTRVWGSVLQELYHFRHLMVLGFGNFKQALDTSMVFEDPLTVKPEVDGEVMGHVEVDPRFPDVEPSVMSQEKWRRVWCCPVHHREPVHLIEARSILGAVKHIARDSRRHGQRFVILNDNMSVVLALQKGRCSSFSLLRLIRRKVEVFTRDEAKAANRRMQSSGQLPERDVLQKERSSSPLRSGKPSRADLRSLLASHKRRQQRGIQRKKKYEARLRATRGERGLLEQSSVREPQRKDYLSKLEGFYSFVVQYDLALSNEKELDEALCDYGDILFLDGYGSNFGEKLMAAVEFERPEFARSRGLVSQEFEGLEEAGPCADKNAHAGVLERCDQRGDAEDGAKDVLMPNHEFDKAVIVLGPLERGESSKAGIYDEVLILDDVRAPFLPSLLHAQACKQRMEKGAEAPLWDFTAKAYLKTWRECVVALGIQQLATSPYQNRHGGASRDHLQRLRSIEEIRRRGRWASETSARIYDKPGRMQQLISQHEGKFRDFGENIRVNFERLYHSGNVVLPRSIKVFSEQNDLGKPKAWNDIISQRATPSEVMGVTGLKPRDEIKVNAANNMLHGACKDMVYAAGPLDRIYILLVCAVVEKAKAQGIPLKDLLALSSSLSEVRLPDAALSVVRPLRGMDWGHRAPFLKSRAEVVGIRMSKEAESQLSSDFKRAALLLCEQCSRGRGPVMDAEANPREARAGFLLEGATSAAAKQVFELFENVMVLSVEDVLGTGTDAEAAADAALRATASVKEQVVVGQESGSTVFLGVVSSQHYLVRVRARNAFGPSPWSDWALLRVLSACPDGKAHDGEACDDGNTVNGDGCSSNCEVEMGWICEAATSGDYADGWGLGMSKCRAAGMDGLRVGDEECDDCNNQAG
ncbi:ppt1 [Symbiodinium natans]|uniref:Serine/threonine-protein phosphatase n=1 Tax=Symbiodinium natans TaxID=878477 RepID=A0A812UAZ8_9DINO|nr:ppt1 [Symbiodinium natans]